MTKEWRIRIARHKLSDFIGGMSPQGRWFCRSNGTGGEPPLLCHVTREAMLERFFVDHPELELIRGELTAEFAAISSLPEFPVVVARWDRVIAV